MNKCMFLLAVLPVLVVGIPVQAQISFPNDRIWWPKEFTDPRPPIAPKPATTTTGG